MQAPAPADATASRVQLELPAGGSGAGAPAAHPASPHADVAPGAEDAREQHVAPEPLLDQQPVQVSALPQPCTLMCRCQPACSCFAPTQPTTCTRLWQCLVCPSHELCYSPGHASRCVQEACSQEGCALRDSRGFPGHPCRMTEGACCFQCTLHAGSHAVCAGAREFCYGASVTLGRNLA